MNDHIKKTGWTIVLASALLGVAGPAHAVVFRGTMVIGKFRPPDIGA